MTARRDRPSNGGRWCRLASTSVNSDMSNEADQIRAQVVELLGEPFDLSASDLDAVAARREEAHDLLVRALESVEKG